MLDRYRTLHAHTDNKLAIARSLDTVLTCKVLYRVCQKGQTPRKV
jgi:hypothetical protein